MVVVPKGGFVGTGTARAGSCGKEAGGGYFNSAACDATASRDASRASRAAGALRVWQPPQERQCGEGCRWSCPTWLDVLVAPVH